MDGAPTSGVAGALKQLWAADKPSDGDWVNEPAVRRLYEARGFSPVFLRSPAAVQRGADLLTQIDDSGSHGLDPARYRVKGVDEAIRALPDRYPMKWLPMFSGNQREEALGRMARLDAMLTDRYLALASDLRFGETARRDTTAVPGDDRSTGPKPDSSGMRVPGAAAESAAGPGTAPRAGSPAPPDTVTAALIAGALPAVGAWAPSHPQYALLRKGLADYRRVVAAGGWGTVDTGPTLRRGERSPRVTQVRARLDAEERGLTGKAPAAPEDPQRFDAALEERVREFQRHHALDDDGSIGKSTVAEMNVPAGDRLKQIEITLLRWRLGPRDEPPYRVEVNIPGMMVYLFNGGLPRLSLRAVVGSGKESAPWMGKTSWARTPELEDEIETIEVNPRWNIPESIVRTELLRDEKRKPGFLDKGGYEWYNPRTGEHGPASQIPEEDWSNPARKLYIRQRSGVRNALGRIKFVFHNRYAVYLHDTPDKRYFKRGRRNFSHGCVRVQNPLELADSLLAHSERQPPRPLKRLMADTTRVVIPLKPSVPIHLVYRTAWVGEDSTLHLLPDLYGFDKELVAGKPPAASGAGGVVDDAAHGEGIGGRKR